MVQEADNSVLWSLGLFQLTGRRSIRSVCSGVFATGNGAEKRPSLVFLGFASHLLEPSYQQEQKADEEKPFTYYVDFLVNGGFVPPNATNWVDHIRKRGNDATHRISLMGRDDAEKVLRFIEMILLFLYEYPNMA